MVDKKELPEDPIIKHIGDFGCYQLFIWACILFVKFPTGWHQLVIVFQAAPIKYWCVKHPTNSSDACDEECTEVAYDRSVFEENIISEWDLICEKAWLANFTQIIAMVGIMVGSQIFGILADIYGRRPALLAACVLQLISGVLTTWSTYFWVFCILRFLVNAFTGATMVTSFVLVMELIGEKKRAVMTIIYQTPFNGGHLAMVGFAYFFRHWMWCQFWLSAFSVLFLFYFCILTESPKWQYTKGKLEAATRTLTFIARRNKMPTENIQKEVEAAYYKMTANGVPPKGKLYDLFRYPNLRKKTICISFCWAVVCLLYYGIAQFMSEFSGNIFENVAIGASLGLPGVLISAPITKYCGRKITLYMAKLVAGLCLFIIAFVPGMTGLPQTIVGGVALFFTSISFPNIYLYCGELYPTVVRNSGFGFSSVIGKLGSIVAPLFIEAGQLGIWLPPFLLGVFAVLSGISAMFLPETKGTVLPDTIEEGEAFGKKVKVGNVANQ